MKLKWTWAVGIAGACLSLFASGCAEEREPINRVQANALHKSFFVGAAITDNSDDPEFYTASTVIDVPYGADQGFVFPGLVGGMTRVKWEIAESTLNARMTYEHIEGVDGHGSRRTNDGRVIASYAITGHFDIRHDYNPSTGEENNVIVENTSDRPWYEREYFRVDWSTNLITGSMEWDPLAMDAYESEPLAYYVSDPADPDAPHFNVDDGYFDITNKSFLSPQRLQIGDNDYPACFYYGHVVIGGTSPWGNCETSEITVRQSFLRVKHEGEAGFTDYQPTDWDGSRMDAFGAFTVNRLGWDRNYGIVDGKWYRFIQRYNIWQQSHTSVLCAQEETAANYVDPNNPTASYDPERDTLNNNGTADECETAGPGSQCDVFVGKCTIPYSQRAVRTVPWHYTVSADDAIIFESTEHATYGWDAAIRIAINAARRSECQRTFTQSLNGTQWAQHVTSDAAQLKASCLAAFPVDISYDDAELDAVRDVNLCVKNGGDRATCSAGYPEGSVPRMEPVVVLCANPVPEGAHPACGAPGTVARPGDIRYHQVNVWPTRQSVSPWGYGPSLGDPLTGEIISAGINVYNAVTDAAAQGFLDQARWIMGELSADDLTSGKHVQDWVRASSYARSQGGALLPKETIDKQISGLTGLNIDKVKNASIARQKIDMGELRDAIRELERGVLPPGVVPEDRSIFEERIKKAKENGVEAELMGPMWHQLAGVGPGHSPEEALELASPLRGMSSRKVTEEYNKTQLALANKGQCLLGAPEPTGLPAIANMMSRKFPHDPMAAPAEQHARLERMWNYLRFKLNYTVILHEMGHTVGLRHNFVSSYDKFNYKTQYWQLRTDSGRQTTPCTGPVADGSSCVGPRYFDPLTPDEIDNSVWTWMNTSVMDYPGDITQDLLSLGIYDLAAAKMFYADTVDVRDDGVKEGDDVGNAIISLVDYPGYVFGQVVSIGNAPTLHHTQYNEAFGLVQPERCVAVQPAQPAWWDDAKWGAWDTVFDGQIVHDERCARPVVDYVQWRDLLADNVTVDFDDDRFFTPARRRDKQGRPRMPYGFLSDEYADGWSPSAFRHDNGADMYEEIVFHSNMYENRHIFDNFRNGRVNFTVHGAYNRALSRYHTKVQSLVQGFAYSVDFILKEFARNRNLDFADVVVANVGPGGFLYDHAVAAATGFDHFSRVLTRPHPGSHVADFSTRILKPRQDEIGIGPQVNAIIPNGNMIAGDSVAYGGRPINNGFQYNHGYWTWNYLDQAGSYYEKTYAFERMLEASYGAINFFRFDGLDARFRHIHYGDLFPEGMRRLIGAMLTEDQQLIAPRMTENSSGGPNVDVADTLYPLDPLSWVSYVPDSGPVACAPLDGILACTDSMGNPVANGAPTTGNAWFIDPQLGYEVQKFIVFWSYVYLPQGEVDDWVDMMRIFRLGSDTTPDYIPAQVVEWRDPESGLRYLAKAYGDEVIFGKTYDRGIAAKMIQWANQLTGQVYVLDSITPYDPVTGAANVVLDGQGNPTYVGGNCVDNPACKQLRNYRGLLDFTRDTASRLGFPEPSLQIWGPEN